MEAIHCSSFFLGKYRTNNEGLHQITRILQTKQIYCDTLKHNHELYKLKQIIFKIIFLT